MVTIANINYIQKPILEVHNMLVLMRYSIVACLRLVVFEKAAGLLKRYPTS